MTKWRLGLDVGSNSIGWAAVRLGEENNPASLLELTSHGHLIPAAGVRIFSDARNPKKESLAVKRREQRGMRRNRDRYLQRRTDFLGALVELGLLPQEEAEQEEADREALEGSSKKNGSLTSVSFSDFDPWCLRTRALDERLAPYQVGKALFHLQQRRGFKSNRKADRDAADGKISEGASQTLARMKEVNARTLGELFGRARLGGNTHTSTRARLNGAGAKAFYDFYPTRDLILDEFRQIWDAQSVHHPKIMTKAARAKLYSILSFQRPLKPQPVGRCTLEPDSDLRAPWALPSSQRRRIYETLNAMHYRIPSSVSFRDLKCRIRMHIY